MVVSWISIAIDEDNKDRILEILAYQKGPTEAIPGCFSCKIFKDLDECMIAYEEVWQNKKTFHEHIRSDLYRNILTAMDLSKKPPEVRISRISTNKGMELIQGERMSRRAEGLKTGGRKAY